MEIEQGWQLIVDRLTRNREESIPLEAAAGRVVVRDLHADQDSPPFAKALMDGFAVAEEIGAGTVLRIVETVTAGQVPRKSIQPGEATRIMTGSPLPEGAVSVVMVEKTERVDDDHVKITEDAFVGQNLLQQATIIAAGEPLIGAGHRIRPHDLGALAEFGLTRIPVHGKSRVAILVTGDELVDPEQTPGPGQIRNSNGTLLQGLATACGAEVISLGIGRDDPDELKQKIAMGLEADMLVLAGGVSAGILDLVPGCLAGNGVHEIFHRLNLKPGRPLWFGISPGAVPVFGLPGNPISSLVCFKLFVEPAIRFQMGSEPDWLEFETAGITADFPFRGGRRTFWPACTRKDGDGLHVTPLDWKGSADQVTYLCADSLIMLEGEGRVISAGHEVPVLGL